MSVPDSPSQEGFVITHIPVGLHVPYQTLYPKQEYYIRAGSGFQPTPHGVLAGMFGRTPQPNVVPVITFQSGEVVQNVPPAIRVNMPVYLVNKGRGVAEDVFCSVEAALPTGSSVGCVAHVEERKWSTTRSGRTSITITLGAKIILPPGAELLVFTIALQIDRGGKGDHSVTVSAGSRNGAGSAGNDYVSRPVSLTKRMRTTLAGTRALQ